jgi:hypothetical protein
VENRLEERRASEETVSGEADRLTLAIAAGFATVAFVLASANWATPLAWVAVAPFTLWSLVLANDYFRGDAEDVEQRLDRLESQVTATDGGRNA